MIVSRNVQVCTCGKCGREFIPLRCPECKSPNWNKDAETAAPKVKDVPAPIEENYSPEPPAPTSEEVEEFVVDLQPKARQSTAKAKPERKRAKEKPASKGGKCPHNFLMLDGGVTACPHCK